MITAYFDAADFFEYCRDFDIDDGNCDYIHLHVSSFESDYIGTTLGIGVPQYSLLPCENLMLSVSLQHQKRMDRKASRCRNEFPSSVTGIFKSKLAETDLFNPIFAPNLPYDLLTCNRLCITAYWLPECGCYMNWMSYRYAGSPKNMTICSSSSPNEANCTKWHGETSTPPEVLPACECFPRCDEQSFYVVNEQRQRYTLGNTGGVLFFNFYSSFEHQVQKLAKRYLQ